MLNKKTVKYFASQSTITNNIRQNIYHRASTIKCTGTHCSLMRNQCTVDVDIRTINIPEHTQLYTDIFRILYVLDNQNIYVCINKNCGNIIEIHPDDELLLFSKSKNIEIAESLFS